MPSKLKKDKKKRELTELTESIVVGKQTAIPSKVVKDKIFNRYFEGQKVTVVAEKYRTAKITKVWIRHGKITYSVKCGDGVVLNKLPEDALLPHVKKWQYNLIKFIGKFGLSIVSS